MGKGRGQGRGPDEKHPAHDTWLKAWENRKLVFKVARRRFGLSRNQCDYYLIDGLRGLCLGIESFDESKGKFGQHVSKYIFGSIYRAIERDRSPIHVPESADRETIGRLRVGIARESEHWSFADVADRDLTKEREATQEAREVIEKALSALPDRTNEIIRRCWGIGRDSQHASNIAASLHMCIRTVQRHQKEGMRQMKAHIEWKATA